MAGVAAVMHVAAAILAEEPKDRTSSSARRSRAPNVCCASPRRRHQARDHHLVDRHRRLWPRPHHRPAHLLRDHFTNLDGMKFTWAYCIGKTKAEQRRLGLRQGQWHGPDHHPSRRDPRAGARQRRQHLGGLVSGLLDGSTPAMPSNGFAIIDVRDSPTCMSRRWRSRRPSASAIWRPPPMCRSPKLEPS